ncbi:MAG TPA: S49 family peptidase, partial [Rhodocyclaceae bacterium]|nr:S49 family peptidase [Rhodocyclaceae bacterium]
FTRGVAKGRGVSVDQVRSQMGQGRCFGADQALSAQMVDSVSTFDQVIARMQKNIKAGSPKASRLARAERELSIMG